MTFDQVLVFHKVVEAGSFKTAAAQLNKTQPAISFSIKKLEQEMGIELFDRSGYRPELTPHGRAFQERSKLLLQGMQDLESLTKSFLDKEEPEISIALDGISPLPKLLGLFKNFSDIFPNTKLNLAFETLSESERKVLTKEAQIGVTHFVSDHQSLEVRPILSVMMVPVMNADLFRSKSVFSQEDLLSIDQIVIGDKNKSSATFGLLDGGKKWRLTDASLKREIIFAGLGWGHMPLHQIESEIQEKKLIVLDFPDVHARALEISLIRLKKHQFGPVARALWDELFALSHGPSL